MFILNTCSIGAKFDKNSTSHWKRTLYWKSNSPGKLLYTQKEKLEKLLTQLKDANIIREMGDDAETGSINVTRIILAPQKDYVKVAFDAKYLNSVTDLTNYSWSLEPVQMITTRVNGKFVSVSHLSCGYLKLPLS